METLTAQELRSIRDEADRKRQGKLKDARISFVAEMREKAQQLDFTLSEVLEFEEESKKRPRKAASPKAKYRSPDGQEWSGRGRAAKWLLDLEAQGRLRDEFLINSILKFFQVDSMGMCRMTSSTRYFKYGVGSSRPN
jgi:DNA-binding protein H-NS